MTQALIQITIDDKERIVLTLYNYSRRKIEHKLTPDEARKIGSVLNMAADKAEKSKEKKE